MERIHVVLWLQVLDAAVGPRLSVLQVFAVHELARLYQLHVLNSDMAADTQVVTRDGATWVQRKQPCVALLDLAPQEPVSPEEQQQEQQPEALAAGAVVSGEQAVASDDSEGVVDPAAGSGATDGTLAAAAAETSAVADTGTTPASDTTQQQQDQQEPAQADALYVVSPDNLVECCHQVAAEVASYIGLLAEEARLRPLYVGGLTTLLEKLLMVQVRRCCIFSSHCLFQLGIVATVRGAFSHRECALGLHLNTHQAWG
jgi:hypothetical protein